MAKKINIKYCELHCSYYNRGTCNRRNLMIVNLDECELYNLAVQDLTDAEFKEVFGRDRK